MSNLVMLTVGKFEALDGSSASYGYTISDNYGRDYNFMWDSAEEFYRDHPTPASLWRDALQSEGFDGICPETDDCGKLIIDPETRCPTAAEFGGASGFSLDGYQPPK